MASPDSLTTRPGCNTLAPCGGCYGCGMETARQARTKAVQYRGFLVGVCIRVEDHEGNLHDIPGWNIYPDGEDETKICAEGNAKQGVDKLAARLGYWPLIRTVFVAATDDPEQNSKVNGLPPELSSTLDLCGGCRDFFTIYPPMRLGTEIVKGGFNERGELTVVEFDRYEGTLARYAQAARPIPSARPIYPEPELLAVGA